MEVEILFKNTNTDSDGWGAGKEAPLTSLEVDQNFFNLKQAVEDLSENVPQPLQIQSITAIDNVMQIVLSDLTTTFNVNMPVATFDYRGTYEDIMAESDPEIALYDFFTTDSGMYLAIQAVTTPDAEFNPNAGNMQGPYYRLIAGPGEPSSGGAAGPLVVSFFQPGSPGVGVEVGEPMFCYMFAEDAYLDAGATLSGAHVRTGHDYVEVYPIYKRTGGGTETEVGTIEFNATENYATLNVADNVEFLGGDLIMVMRPAFGDSESSEPFDPAARDLAITFGMFRGQPESA